MISEAAVMSKPVWRSVGVPGEVTMRRRARSLTSMTRFQVT